MSYIHNISKIDTLQDLFEVLDSYSESERRVICSDSPLVMDVYERGTSDDSVMWDFTIENAHHNYND